MRDDAMSDALRDFGMLVTVEMQSINEDMQAAIGAIVAQSAARGLLVSGASMSQVATAAAKTLPQRARVALLLMARSFEAHGVPVGPDNKQVAIENMLQFIENYRVQLRSIVEQTAPFRGKLPDAARNQVLGYIDKQATLERERSLAEISLLEAATIQRWGQKLNG
jgi:hypothetical protein